MRCFTRVRLVASLTMTLAYGASLPAEAQTAPEPEPSPALQPQPSPDPLARARALYDEAEFDALLEALARAEASDDLDRERLIELLFLRALTHRAMGNERVMLGDLERIAYLDPHMQPPSELPPSMRHAFERARADVEPLRLLGELTRLPDGIRYAVRASGDPRGLIRRATAACRAPGAPWVQGRASSVELPAFEGEVVECYATLIGPGGAELTRRGTEADPLALDVPAAPLERSELDEALPYLLAGVAVLVAGAAAAAVGLTVAPPPTRVNTPEP